MRQSHLGELHRAKQRNKKHPLYHLRILFIFPVLFPTSDIICWGVIYKTIRYEKSSNMDRVIKNIYLENLMSLQ